MPAILSPARAIGSTATPPAAPKPITTTSTGFKLVAILRSPRRCVCRFDRRHLLLFRRDGQTHARVADQVPARKILVPAIVRIAKRRFERHPPDAIEKARAL